MISCKIEWRDESRLKPELRPYCFMAETFVRAPQWALRLAALARAATWSRAEAVGPLMVMMDHQHYVCAHCPGWGWACASLGVGPATVLVGAGAEPTILVSSESEAVTRRLIRLVERVRPRWLIGLHEADGELHALWGGLGRQRDPSALAKAVRGRRVRNYHRVDEGAGFYFWPGFAVQPFRSRPARAA